MPRDAKLADLVLKFSGYEEFLIKFSGYEGFLIRNDWMATVDGKVLRNLEQTISCLKLTPYQSVTLCSRGLLGGSFLPDIKVHNRKPESDEDEPNESGK